MSSEIITSNDLKSILNEVIPGTGVNYVIEPHTEQITISAGTYDQSTFTVTKTGYYPIGVVGHQIGWVSGNTGRCNVFIVRMESKSYESATIAYGIFNLDSASITTNFKVDILWAKVDSASAFAAQDFVVEQGTSGIWTYRKWDSGIAECWGKHSWTITAWNTWGNLYESNSTYVNYPTNLFVEEPLIDVQHNATTGQVGAASVEVWTGGTGVRTPNINLVRGGTGATNATAFVNIFAKGLWK